MHPHMKKTNLAHVTKQHKVYSFLKWLNKKDLKKEMQQVFVNLCLKLLIIVNVSDHSQSLTTEIHQLTLYSLTIPIKIRQRDR